MRFRLTWICSALKANQQMGRATTLRRVLAASCSSGCVCVCVCVALRWPRLRSASIHNEQTAVCRRGCLLCQNVGIANPFTSGCCCHWRWTIFSQRLLIMRRCINKRKERDTETVFDSKPNSPVQQISYKNYIQRFFFSREVNLKSTFTKWHSRCVRTQVNALCVCVCKSVWASVLQTTWQDTLTRTQPFAKLLLSVGSFIVALVNIWILISAQF